MFNTTNFQRRMWVIIQIASSVILIVLTKRFLGRGMDTLMLTSQMLLVGGAILLGLMWWRGERVKWEEVKKILPAGVVGGGLAYWLGFVGLSLTQASNYAFLTKFTTVFTCVLAFIVLGEKWNKYKTTAILFIILGSLLISTQGKSIILGRGDWWVMVSSLFYAISYVLAAKAMKHVSALAASTYRTLIGGIILGIIWMLMNRNIWWLGSEIIFGGMAVAVAVLSAHKVMRVSNASYMVLMTSLIPVATSLIMISFFGEKMSLIQVFGAGTILLGSWITEIKN